MISARAGYPMLGQEPAAARTKENGGCTSCQHATTPSPLAKAARDNLWYILSRARPGSVFTLQDALAALRRRGFSSADARQGINLLSEVGVLEMNPWICSVVLTLKRRRGEGIGL